MVLVEVVVLPKMAVVIRPIVVKVMSMVDVVALKVGGLKAVSVVVVEKVAALVVEVVVVVMMVVTIREQRIKVVAVLLIME